MTFESTKQIPESQRQQEQEQTAPEAVHVNDNATGSGGVSIVEEVCALDAPREQAVAIESLSKRTQENPFESSKRARTFLELSKGKSVNHFSQSARILQRRASPPPSDAADLTLVSDHRSKSQIRRGPFIINPEAIAISGRSRSDPLSSSSFLSRLNAVVSEDSRDLDQEQDTALLMPPPPNRSRTFAGSTSSGQVVSSSSKSASSPFLMADSSRPPSSKINASKPVHSAPKRLGHPQSLLKQTLLVTPSASKPRGLSFQPLNSAVATPTVTTMFSEDGEQDEAKANIAKNNEGTFDKDLDSLIAPGVASCTVAMNSLSPPSAKTAFNVFARRRRPSFMGRTTSSSLPVEDTASFSSSDSEDDEGLQGDSRRSTSVSTTPTKVITATKVTTTSGAMLIRRPMMLRRHQTMISNPSEFMRTLESGSRRRTSSFSTMIKKSLVFAADDYIPDPSRQDCQVLPCATFAVKPEDTTKRVTPQTVVDVLDGKFKDHYDLLYIIDCRFPYEFEGGHIKSAVNVNTTDKLEELLLQPAITDKRVLLIFHCEFSCERGPRMARHLRNQDRAANASHYPAVFYPEVYVMQGGYSGFFKENKSYCWPEAYVEMQDENHSREFEKHMRTFGREFSRTASKGFLGTESKKQLQQQHHGSSTSSGDGSAIATSSPLKTTLASSSSTSVESKSTAGGATSGGTITTTRTALTTHTTSRSAVNTIFTTASSISKQRMTPSSKAFATVLSSVKGAALSGAGPSSLSLASSIPKQPPMLVNPTNNLSTSKNTSLALHRPSIRPRAKTTSLTEHILKDVARPHTQPQSGSGSAVSVAIASARSRANLSSGSSTGLSVSSGSSSLANSFFSGFRQTKPVFRGVSP